MHFVSTHRVLPARNGGESIKQYHSFGVAINNSALRLDAAVVLIFFLFVILVGYLRLILVFSSFVYYNNAHWFLGFYITSVLLDAVDGFVARRLNQTSAFGAWFDVVIDLISRGALWCFLSPWGYFIMMIEWLTFVSTHTRGQNWKIPDEEFPWICKKVMAKGFKTPVGTYAITGIFVLPLWLYGIQSQFLTKAVRMSHLVQYFLCLFLVGGRLLALITELFYIWQHIKAMLLEDVKPSHEAH